MSNPGPYTAASYPISAFGAASDGVTDDTAAIQLADLFAAAHGGGNVIYPTGRQTVIGGQVVISPGVRHCSLLSGPFDPASLANVPVILVPNAAQSPFTFASRNAELSDLLFYYPNQIPPTSGANPTVYPATVSTPAGSALCKMRRLTLANAYQGFNLQGGRHILEDIWAGCLSNVWTLDNNFDVVHFKRIVCNPFWNPIVGLGYPQAIDTWVNANKLVGQFFRADAPIMEDIFGFGGLVGLRMDDTALAINPKPSYGSGSNIRFDTFTNGIICKSTQSPGWQIQNFSCNTSANPIIMAAGGGTAPKLRISAGAFWGTTNPANTGGGLYLDNVQNYNPQGTLTPPAVPASGGVLANPFPTTCMFLVTAPAGVTVSAIGIGPGQPATGVTVAAGTTSPPIYVGANEGIKLTYAGGNPTWAWFGL
jgi:hypothetical protein